MKKTILTLLVLLSAGLAQAQTDSFTQQIRCVGGATDSNSGKWSTFAFKINEKYQEEADSVLNVHYVEVTTTKVGVFTQTKKYAHPSFSKNCRLSNNIASCSGIGLGNGQQEFELDINLRNMTAQGKLKTGSYPNEDYNEVYTFGDKNLLSCSM